MLPLVVLACLLVGVLVPPAGAQYTIAAPELVRPRAHAAQVLRKPTFEWTLSAGAVRYELVLDGAVVATPGLACTTTCTFRVTEALSRGDHRWLVRAFDEAGSSAASVEQSFRVNVKPRADLAAPQLTLTGRRVRFDASDSRDVFGERLAQFDWDLDGNGTFETNTGRRPRVRGAFDRPGRAVVKVRVTDAGGLVDEAAAAVDVRPRPPAGAPGVTISGGARRTTSLAVQLSLVWPRFATHAVISNGGSDVEVRRRVTETVAWQLARSGGKRRRVVVRFEGAPDGDETFADAIRYVR